MAEQSNEQGVDILIDAVAGIFIDCRDPLTSAINFRALLDVICCLNWSSVPESNRHILNVALLLKGAEVNRALESCNLPKLTICAGDIARSLSLTTEHPRPMGVKNLIA